MKEKRNMAAVLGTLLLSIMFVFSYVSDVSAHTAADRIRVVDQAGLLSDGEEAQLSDQLDEISERQQVDVVVVTADSLEGASAMEYADDFLIIMAMDWGMKGMVSFFSSLWKTGVGISPHPAMESWLSQMPGWNICQKNFCRT